MKTLKVEATEERGPHRSREQVRILKELGTLKAALISVGKPGQASAASMQCLAEFGIYHDLQMTPQEAHHVTLCPQWKIVLNTMIESCRNELQCKAIKQDRWNNREADRQAKKAFLEEHKGPGKFSGKYEPQPTEHKGPGKFSGKYGPQPTQTELLWRMPWGCWLMTGCSRRHGTLQPRSSLKPLHAGQYFLDNISHKHHVGGTTVHQIQGARITLSVSYNQKDWGAMQEWIAFDAGYDPVCMCVVCVRVYVHIHWKMSKSRW